MINNHFAIFIDNNSDKKLLFEAIIKGNFVKDALGRKFETYSELSLQNFIENEDRFGKNDFDIKTKQSIASLSGGEQRKALLNFCISQKPDYLILDNPFDNLDISSQQKIKSYLEEIAHTINIIQIVNRKADILSFINNFSKVNFYNKQIVFEPIDSADLQIKVAPIPHFSANLPPPISSINIDVDSLVKFDNVTVKYADKTIIKNICWKVKSGEFWQLVGPNGAGKTTILSLIIGDNPKAFGEKIYLFGKLKGSGEAVWDIKKQLGYFTPSMTNLFGRGTTAEQMIVSGIFDSIGLYKIPSERQMRLANEWIKLLGFQTVSKTPFYRLTPGQQRLIMIARAMVKHPPLLILDEPTAGLDDHNALLVSYLINKISQESETAIIYVSHRMEPNLLPQFIFELTASSSGSTGQIYRPN